MANKFMVMSAITYDGRSYNRDTCFEFNAVDLPSMEAAEAEAERRNKIEAEAGHINVEWFPCPMMDIFRNTG